MKKWKLTIPATTAIVTLGLGVNTVFGDSGQLGSDGYYHYFIGYDDVTSASIQTVSAYIQHGANNVETPNPDASIWTMGVNTSNGTFEQTGLAASSSTAYGNPGTGAPVYFFAMEDLNGYHEIDGTYGSAVGANHQYSATWSYASNGTDTLAGYIDGHSAGAFSSTAWPIPNEIQNLMEETDPTSTDTSDGFGSQTSPEIYSDMRYTSTGGSTTNITSGVSSKMAGYEHFMSGSDATYFGVFDGRND